MSNDSVPRRKSRSISSFLKKTYQILQHQQNSNVIKWAASGVGFVVIKEDQFSKQVLPKYFKHSNYSSFVRQLNMYNFHKVREANFQSHFHHEHFCKDDKGRLAEISRKPEKKKRKGDEESEYEPEEEHDRYDDKSDISMKCRLKQNNISISRVESGEIKIPSSKSTCRKSLQNTHHAFSSQKQNKGRKPSISENSKQTLSPKPQIYQSQQRVSIQNILANQNDDDKLSINNQIQNYPRYPTRQMFCPSSNNIFPFPAHLKGNVISQFNIFL